MNCCAPLQDIASCCKPYDNTKETERLLKVTKDKFLKFVVKNGGYIRSLAIISIPKKYRENIHDNKSWANCIVTYEAYNLEGKYYLELTEKQLNALHEKA